MARVVLAMSGGVDSSVAAWLLREQGHDVIGLFMRHGQASEAACSTDAAALKGTVPFSSTTAAPRCPRKLGQSPAAQRTCCSAADAADARRVADMLGISFYAVNFEQEFARIVDYFVAEYTAGRTPNPCIVCNTWLKFGRLFQYADSVGADYVATGHYARLVPQKDGQIALCRGLDESKDQSYVLFGIERRLLPRLMFPVGDHRKDAIRQMAGQLGLHVAAKRDSQEICFVPDQDHARFIRERRGDVDTSGDIVTSDGTIVGHHDGFERFTIGQRKGLRVAFGTPRYVVAIEPASHRVVIGGPEELARRELLAAEANWLVEHVEGDTIRAQVKIRYRSRPVDATVECLAERRFRVMFDAPCLSVAPGQAAVCYENDRVIGGGWIQSGE